MSHLLQQHLHQQHQAPLARQRTRHCQPPPCRRPFSAASQPARRGSRVACAAAAAAGASADLGGRRGALAALLGSPLLLLAAPGAASATPLEDVARQLTRPSDVTPLQAAVALLDARATLRDMAPLVASAPDSAARFNGRRLWPAYAKWLRPVGPSAPVAAATIAGGDVESTLSAQYGGTGGSDATVDAVYVALGRVLTISGRTIRDEAQFDPQLAKDAEVAIDAVVAKLPAGLVQQAQQFRVDRAAGGK